MKTAEFAMFAEEPLHSGWQRHWQVTPGSSLAKPKPFRPLSNLFPDVATEEDLEDVVAVGDLLSPDVLLTAYYHGIFPWPHQGFPLLWFSPSERGVLRFSKVRINRSLKRALKEVEGRWSFSVNESFAEVMNQCQTQKRAGQSGTWITADIIAAYQELHKLGYAHSAEVWDGDRLVGGIYGVEVAGVFSGESMFFREDNASKMVLVYLCDQLEKRGHTYLDIEMVTPATKSLGGEYVSRKAYYKILRQSQVPITI